jgi:hypothetical protein
VLTPTPSSTTPCSRHRALQPVGVTRTAIQVPQIGQKWGGSFRLHPAHSAEDFPQPVQNAVSVVTALR